MASNLSSDSYDRFLDDLKEWIQIAQLRAATAVNRELVTLYWRIGCAILAKQQQEGWGAKVIERLSKDLKQAFPEIKGFSRSNLLYMRAFAQSFPDETVIQAVMGQITWYHNIALLDKLKANEERLWYAQKTIEHGWSRSALVHQIESGLHQRIGNAVNNFDHTLPQSQSDLARQILKSPYNFEFLELAEAAQERDFERALVDRIRDFLLELGVGFSFLGSQYSLEIGGKEYKLDLLFYHVKLHCYVVIDLKMVEFEPEFSGKMSFYIAAVDDLLRSEMDNPTIGIVLCKSKNKATVEYALRYIQHPVGVATYRLKDTLPEPLQRSLPSIEQLEMELNALAAEANAKRGASIADPPDLDE
jgi:predicted nuclease of restriction endonuclease-like (RecB) superfamily